MNSVISTEDINNNIDYYAKEFSEGNPTLEKLLKDMWNRGYETIGCCTGHEDDETAKPYIAFKVNNKKQTLNLISSINKKNVRISLTTYKGGFNCGILSRSREDIFENIINSLNQENVDKELEEIFNKMNELDKEYHNNLLIYYNDNSIIEGIRLNTEDKRIIDKLIKDNYSYQILNKNIYHFIIK